jgi:hypothetical protein
MSQNKGSKKDNDYKIKDHLLYFSRLKVLRKIFKENKADAQKRWMVFKIFFFATLVQPFMWLQDLIYKKRIKQVDLSSEEKAPIFILGHYRSGTTHLHYLMAKDPQLGHLNNFQGFLITISLLGKGWLDWLLAPLVPNKRPMDNMKMNMYAPQEEDLPVSNLTAHNGMHSYFFPKNQSYFQKYTLMRNVSDAEKKEWQKAYDKVLRIVSVGNNNKRLVIKNPLNTGRLKELLELYPNAKFVYIHRNPYEVYRSTRKLYNKTIGTQFLQEVDEAYIQDMIFNNYKGMMQQYIDQRSLAAPNQLIEISFEELIADGEGTMQKIYQELKLPNWENAKPEIQAYLESVKDYKRNKFKPLSSKINQRIQKDWKFVFDEWKYPLEQKENSSAT